MAKDLNGSLVRVMSFRKEMIILGFNGAGKWVATDGSWPNLLKLFELPVRRAEEEDNTLVVETGNNTMINSRMLGRKLIDDLGTKHLKILWDILKTLNCTEIPYPNAHDEIKECIGHIHMKDCKVDIPLATVSFCPLGHVTWRRTPMIDSIVSHESVYSPAGGDFEDSFQSSLPILKKQIRLTAHASISFNALTQAGWSAFC